jgi:hypothetical protein
MGDEMIPGERARGDRRKRPTSLWDAFRLRGRRMRNRRADEERKPHVIDRFPTYLVASGLLMLLLTIVDGVFTLVLLDADCEEANPAMGYLLGHGPMAFLLGKYALTAAFLPVCLVLNRCFLFRTRFRVGYLFPIFVALYILLVGYQLVLLSRGVFA